MNTTTSLPADFPPIEEILPHRGTMLLLDRMTAFTSESGSAEYAPRRDQWYSDAQGRMPAWIGLELMAQTIAAHVGLLKRREGAPTRQGALLGTRSYRSTRPAFCPDETLRIEATLVYRDNGGLGAYDCAILLGDETVATATLKVYEPDDFQTFLQGNRS